MMRNEDTIAAIATAAGEAGVAVVRISGPRALEVADRVFLCRSPPPSQRPSHTVTFGRIVREGETIDEGLLLIMRGPVSYTGEDVVELHCHGGLFVPRAVLDAVCRAGARPARPGEFTERAFLNGKMDLTQAEAVLELVRAHSERGMRAALRQLEGGLRQKIDRVYDRLLEVATILESSVDFSEYIDDQWDADQFLHGIESIRQEIDGLMVYQQGSSILRHGLRVAIAGDVNVGKSTLFNALLGRDRAIVSPQPGTTRDIIEDTFVLDGLTVRLFDMAGIRPTDCAIEAEGIRRARATLETCDLILYVYDLRSGLRPSDRATLAGWPEEKIILVANKVDLVPDSEDSDSVAIKISALKQQGLDALLAELRKRISVTDISQDFIITERHVSLLRSANEALIQAAKELERGEAHQMMALHHLKAALDSLGEITGRTYTEALLDSIFKRFCIGK